MTLITLNLHAGALLFLCLGLPSFAAPAQDTLLINTWDPRAGLLVKRQGLVNNSTSDVATSTSAAGTVSPSSSSSATIPSSSASPILNYNATVSQYDPNVIFLPPLSSCSSNSQCLNNDCVPSGGIFKPNSSLICGCSDPSQCPAPPAQAHASVFKFTCLGDGSCGYGLDGPSKSNFGDCSFDCSPFDNEWQDPTAGQCSATSTGDYFTCNRCIQARDGDFTDVAPLLLNRGIGFMQACAKFGICIALDGKSYYGSCYVAPVAPAAPTPAAPAVGSPAPAANSPAPAVGSPAPAANSPAPAVGSPAPAANSPAPAAGSPAPAAESPVVVSPPDPQDSAPAVSSSSSSTQSPSAPETTAATYSKLTISQVVAAAAISTLTSVATTTTQLAQPGQTFTIESSSYATSTHNTLATALNSVEVLGPALTATSQAASGDSVVAVATDSSVTATSVTLSGSLILTTILPVTTPNFSSYSFSRSPQTGFAAATSAVKSPATASTSIGMRTVASIILFEVIFLL